MADIPVKQRIEWIDCAKGIAMLLVLLGHSVYGTLRGMIFSFHMPLFFILSAMTYRLSADTRQLGAKSKKAFFHLFLPALLLYGLDVGGHILLALRAGTFRSTGAFWLTKGLTMIFASGAISAARPPMDLIPVERMGIPWFLIVLAIGRSLFDWLHLKAGRGFGLLCLLLGVAGVIIGQYFWLPLSFDVALASLLFLLVGYWLRRFDFNKRPLIRFLIASGIWLGTFLLLEPLGLKYLEMSARRYPLYPLCLLTAVSGTMMVAYFSIFLVRFLRWLKRPLLFIGEHSLMMLCVHTLDFMWEGLYLRVSHQPLLQAIARIGIDLAVFLIVVFIKKLIGKKELSK